MFWRFSVDECDPEDPPTSKTDGCTPDTEHSYSGSGKRKPESVETVERERASGKSKPKAPKTRVYSPAWEKEYPWLSTSDGQQLHCSVCKAANMKNSFASPTGASEYINFYDFLDSTGLSRVLIALNLNYF
jgi:hypothetical protein